jgi:Ca2+-binding RTX toxin-like protein
MTKRRRYVPAVDRLEDRLTPAVIVTDAPSFALQVTGGERIAVFNNGGFIAFAANNSRQTATTPSNDVVSITVTATGPFANTIDVSSLSAADFPSLTSVFLNGGDGDDQMVGSSFADRMDGGGDSDDMKGGGGNDELSAGSGDDMLRGEDGADTLNGGAGNDRLVASQGDTDRMDGGSGRDTLDYSGFSSNISVNLGSGSGSNAIIVGIEDVIGGGANDTLVGDAGINQLAGGAGADFLSGGPGNDILDGGKGDDVLDGDEGDDIAQAFADANFIVTDTLVIGQGRDTIRDIATVRLTLSSQSASLGSGGDAVVPGHRVDARGRTGKLEVIGSEGNDTMLGGSGSDIFQGRGGNDMLLGNGGADVLVGSAGNDTLRGGLGRDILDGGSGNDSLDGGRGVDTLTGGAGSNRIVDADRPLRLSAPRRLPPSRGATFFGRRVVMQTASPGGYAQLRIAATRGRLRVSARGLRVLGNNSRSLTLTGTAAQLRSAMRTLSLLLGNGSLADLALSLSDGVGRRRVAIRIAS